MPADPLALLDRPISAALAATMFAADPSTFDGIRPGSLTLISAFRAAYREARGNLQRARGRKRSNLRKGVIASRREAASHLRPAVAASAIQIAADRIAREFEAFAFEHERDDPRAARRAMSAAGRVHAASVIEIARLR